jgi:CP family cyanate transporter-like MFS transporter
MNKKTRISNRIFLIFVISVASNLRMSLTAVSPLFPALQSSWGVSSSFTSLLVTIPLLCFAVGAIATPAITRHLGLKATLITMSAALAAASLLRPTNEALLIIGTVLVGLSISCLNVALPQLIVTVRPTKSTKLTSYYSLSQSLFSALATAIVVPLASHIGWQATLRLFAIPAVLVLLFAVFLPLPTKPQLPTSTDRLNAKPIEKSPFKDSYAWLLALFMALQSLIYYSLSTWLPSIFISFGADEQSAGILLSVFQLIGIPAALLVSLIPSQKIILWLNAAGYAIGIVALPFGAAGRWAASIALGFTAALIFTQAIALINSSGMDPQVVAARSGFAQGIGYLVAASGPVVLGWLPSVFGTWEPTLWCFAATMALAIGFGALILSKRKQQER